MDVNSPRILLVEDNLADATMIQKGFEQCQHLPRFSVVKDGQEAIDYLNRCLNDQTNNKPDFIFLDLDLPKIDGYGVLEYIAANSELLSIAVFVLSDHILTEVNLGRYRWQVERFFGKPFKLAGYDEIVETVESIWLQRAST